MNQYTTDEIYMLRCLQLAAAGRQQSRPNPMVGAVIVYQGKIIGEGYHVCYGHAHAEVNAFSSVKAEHEHLLPFSTLYVSLEPCAHHGKTPPCAELILRKGVRRVVVGCVDSFSKVSGRGIEMLRSAGVEVCVGILEKQCRWMNRRFFTFHEQQRPYIILKWAQSRDGFIDRCGKPVMLSTELTRLLVHKLRAQEDAIVVGHRTFEREHPQLNVRYWSGKDPVKFVLTSQNPIEKILSACVEQQLQSLIVEGGRLTLQSFIDKGLWDEIRVETNPRVIVNHSHGASLLESTPAPEIPGHALQLTTQHIDGNIIYQYVNTAVK